MSPSSRLRSTWRRSPLSLHDALPICHRQLALAQVREPLHEQVADREVQDRVAQELETFVVGPSLPRVLVEERLVGQRGRSEEHTSELQSPCKLVCRLLLEKQTAVETA